MRKITNGPWILATALVALSGSPGATQQLAPVTRPPAVKPQKPANAAQRQPRATVNMAPYRYDDILWENDRIAHRIYGEALEAAEPPSSSGIDAWGKNVRWPFMERQLHTGDQHGYHGEGLDFYDVGTFRGVGGLGVWQDNKLWVSRNYHHYKILQNGPEVARFQVSYAPWPVGVDRKVWETRRFSLPLGSNFTRLVSIIRSDKPGPMLVGIGISKHPTSPTKNGTLHVDRKRGTLAWWGPEDPVKGAMAAAIMVDPAMIAEVREDAHDYLVLLRVQPGKAFVYYTGAAWDKGLDFRTEAQWDAYVAAQKPDFDPKHD